MTFSSLFVSKTSTFSRDAFLSFRYTPSQRNASTLKEQVFRKDLCPSAEQTVTHLDRNVLAMSKDDPAFTDEFLSIATINARQAFNRRIHGSSDTLWAGVVPAQKK